MSPVFNDSKGLNFRPLHKNLQCSVHLGLRRFVVKIFKIGKISGCQSENQSNLFSRTERQVT